MLLVMWMRGGRRDRTRVCIILWSMIPIFIIMFCEILPDFLSFCGDLVFVLDVIIMIFIGELWRPTPKLIFVSQKEGIEKWTDWSAHFSLLRRLFAIAYWMMQSCWLEAHLHLCDLCTGIGLNSMHQVWWILLLMLLIISPQLACRIHTTWHFCVNC